MGSDGSPWFGDCQVIKKAFDNVSDFLGVPRMVRERFDEFVREILKGNDKGIFEITVNGYFIIAKFGPNDEIKIISRINNPEYFIVAVNGIVVASENICRIDEVGLSGCPEWSKEDWLVWLMSHSR
ncbi:MAG: hypothetical protein WC284_09195 [Candidimonas sp.]